MARELILETTFLVDLEREARRDAPGPAMVLLARGAESVLNITFTIAGEMAAGASLDARPVWEAFLSSYRVLGCTIDVCWRYGEIYRHLQRQVTLIGTNDLWIAATALAHSMPEVTRNSAQFARVPGLDVVAYGPRAGG